MANPNPVDIEQAIVDRLAFLRDTGLIVHALPEKPKEYGELLESTSKGVLTLVCFDEKPQGKVGANRRMQAVTRIATIYGRVRGLRGDGDLFDLQNQISQYLIGFCPPKCGAMRYSSGFKFLGRTDSDWEFEIGFQFPMMIRGIG
ncbi:MAG: Gp37 family protein [Cyanobacteria bacterium J06559_3]